LRASRVSEVMSGMGKIGEITIDLNKDVKKDAKESLNSLFYGVSMRSLITILEDAKKATKVKIIIETA